MTDEQATPAAQEETPVVPTVDTLDEPAKPNKAEQIAQDQRKRAEKAEEHAEQLEGELAKLRKDAMTGLSLTEVNAELKRLAETHNIDETFLAGLVSTVEKSTAKKIREEMEKDFSPKVERIEQERAMERREKKFDELFSKTLADNPEYESFADKEIVKLLAFNPSNAKKTLPEILESVYGKAVQGRKTIESTHASRTPEEVDVNNPTSDDWNKIENDPEARKKWAEKAEKEIRQYL